MTRGAWWHCFSGIAGDMALASLLDAGADPDMVRRGLSGLALGDWSLEVSRTSRAGIGATQLRVISQVSGEPRTWADIRSLLDEAQHLPDRVKRRAQEVFSRLASAEARAHGVRPEEVHFHEVGAVDAIVDVVGTCLALESLEVDKVWSSPVAFGAGVTRSADGVLPNPPPAVVELLKGAPVYGTAQTRELTTPTGAALLAALVEGFGAVPAMKIRASGYGAGSADLGEFPNVLQVLVGDMAPAADDGRWDQLLVLETNLDDVTGETLAHAVAELLAAGALDAWLTSVTGKKGRPAYVLNALCEPAGAAALVELIAAETGSLGIRQHSVRRWAAPREVTEVEVEGWPVRVKAGPHRFKAEYEDCAKAARALGVPLADIAHRAEQIATGAVGGPQT